MFYEAPGYGQGLARDPIKALVAPRPVGWISSMGADGSVNLAPYSFFNLLSDDPAMVMFSSDGRKDSVTNVEATGEFVCNLATWGLREQVSQTSAPVPHGHSEFELAGLTPAPSVLVRPPRVAETPVALECRYIQTVNPVTLDGGRSAYFTVIGQVVGVHVDDTLIADGVVDITRARPISRLGYRDYAVIEQVFQMTRPKPARGEREPG